MNWAFLLGFMADLNVSSKGSLREQLNLSCLCGIFMLSPHDIPVTELIKV